MILEAVEFEPVKQGRSLVVTIGINEYVHWQKLKNAVQDAIGLQQILIDKVGFSAPIPPLINEAATKVAIASLIEDQLREELQEDDNLVLFFAGHGHTRADKVGGKVVGETGFIVPVEARGPKEYWSDYIQIDPLLQSISRLPARHILVILDSCHSGFALGEAMKSFRDAVPYEKYLSSQISRKVITSARREQLARDGGPIPGHSLFTGTLVDGFKWGKADLDGNGLITSSELGLFIQQQVAQASQSNQTPDFGSFYLDDRGEMVISLRNQSFDALKARAFSALQRGEFTTFKELVNEIVLLKPSSPEALYLEYRLMIFEGDFERANVVIDMLNSLHFTEGTIPLSRNELWELTAILSYWTPILKIPESEFGLNLTVLVGKDTESLKPIEQQTIGEIQGYYIENNALLQIGLNNSNNIPIYIYAIRIDPSGFIEPIILLKPDIILNGLIPGGTEFSHLFFIPDQKIGIGEIRLFTSPQRLDWFMFHPEALAKVPLPPPSNIAELENIRRKSFLYTI
ncbi:caspase family protein [Microcoleus sp. Pol10D4]|uniref:caspase family protein n=1 Tax=Microcoleus sp. Pol10D4 TaxID=3055387 RepID=UPI002FCFE104